MLTKKTPSQKVLKSHFYYNEGVLYWKIKPSSSVKIYDRAGCIRGKDGYHKIKMSRREYKTSRLIWVWHNGEIPEGKSIKHIDGNIINDRIENLKLI